MNQILVMAQKNAILSFLATVHYSSLTPGNYSGSSNHFICSASLTFSSPDFFSVEWPVGIVLPRLPMLACVLLSLEVCSWS